MADSIRLFRIFLSSPGDVGDERAMALKIIETLQTEAPLRGRCILEPVAWDKNGVPLQANMTPQKAIDQGLPKPSQCDIVVVIFWARMGTPLAHPQYQKNNGMPYYSGTEWEYDDAMQAAQEAGSPKVIIYRRMEDIAFNPKDSDFTDKYEQWKRVEAFFEQFNDKDTGIASGGYNTYKTPDEFGKLLEANLKHLLENLLKEEPAPTPKPKTIQRKPPKDWQESPFPGLRAFTAKDEPIFYGRERETYELAKRLTQPETHFVAVVGASGSGKSSLVGAGLIPRLLNTSPDDSWMTLRFTPDEYGSGNPFHALAVALSELPGVGDKKLANSLRENPQLLSDLCAQIRQNHPKQAQLLLFIDQFEELFTTVEPQYRSPFVDMLVQLTQSDGIHTIITLRSDFYASCVADLRLADLLKEGTYPLSAPSAGALYEMITRPAARAGLEFEGDLAKQILDDTGEEPGALALMAYMLDELYRTCKGTGKLTYAAYESLGRVQGAIGRRSEAVFNSLSKEAQEALPRVFRELVNVKDDGTPTRQRGALEQITRQEADKQLVDAFASEKARLLVLSKGETNQPYVEVAHEALLRSWERLAKWIDDTQDDLHLLRQVRLAAKEWDEQDHRDDYLWSHERLLPVYTMRDRLGVEFSPLELEFTAPEFERLLEEFKAPSTREYRRQVIVDRCTDIGSRAVPTLVSMLNLTQNSTTQEGIYTALKQYIDDALIVLSNTIINVNTDVRIEAASALGSLGDVRAVDPLVQSLQQDASADVRIAAASALGRLGDVRAVDPLLERLQQDASADVQIEAARALGRLGDVRAVDPLVQSLQQDASADVRIAAASALGSLGDVRAVDPLVQSLQQDANVNVRSEAASALGSLGDVRAVDPLLERLQQDANEKVRIAAASALGSLGDVRAVDPLLERLQQDANVNVRIAAASALGSLGDVRAVDPLLERLQQDASADVRIEAASALGSLGDVRAVDPLVQSLQQDANEKIRIAAASALGRLGDVRAVDPLLERLQQDANVNVRSAAARALGRLGDVRAVDPLLERLQQDANVNVRSAAASALGSLGDVRAVDPLVQSLQQDASADVQIEAASALGRLGDVRAVDPLVQSLQQDASADVRIEAASALGSLGDVRAVDPLAERLDIKDSWIGIACTLAIWQLGSSRFKEIDSGLIYGLQNTSWVVRFRAADLIGTLAFQSGTPYLLKALQDPDGDVQRAVWGSLGDLEVTEVRTHLRLKSRKNDLDGWVALSTLSNLGDNIPPESLSKAVDGLIKILTDSNSIWYYRISAAKALGRLAAVQAIPALAAALKDEDLQLRWAAVWALERIGTAEALEAVKQWRSSQKSD